MIYSALIRAAFNATNYRKVVRRGEVIEWVAGNHYVRMSGFTIQVDDVKCAIPARYWVKALFVKFGFCYEQ